MENTNENTEEIKTSKPKVEKTANSSNKDFFVKLGIFTGFIAIIFGILIYSVVLSKKAWQKNLKSCVEEVLDEHDSNDWIVGNAKNISNPFTINAACYEANNRSNGQVYSAVIIRVATFYGPVSAVFIVDEDDKVELMGFSSLHGRIADTMLTNIASKRFEYWERKIPEIIK